MLRMRPALAALLVAAMVAASGVASAQRRTTSRGAPARPATPYSMGYQKGYTEGYRQGSADYNRSAPRDYENSEAFQRRQQSYAPQHASNDEYVMGFELGFEIGYMDGYYGRASNSATPANGATLAKAAALARARDREHAPPADTRQDDRRDASQDVPQTRPDDRMPPQARGAAIIPKETQFYAKLNDPIDTQNNRVGDRFTLTVTSPLEYEGYIIEGHIATLNKSGKLTGKTEMGLAFDKIITPDRREGKIDANLERIIESDKVRKVDEEGRVESGSRTQDTAVRGAGGAVLGAIIGGVIGGGKGAAIGAILGGAGGAATVYVEGNKDLYLDAGTEMVIRAVSARAR
ncbi:MAG TPA: hypothetical protein VNO70_25665 [Blastocatellia bacterium]|nr:hypothetical protein [Blastocatellia bacterium]